MVNGSLTPSWFTKSPTAVQFPGDAHDTDRNSASGVSFCMSSSNCAGRANAHTPLVDVIVNASSPPLLFLNDPTAVQFPGDAHDTSENSTTAGWTSSENSAGRASSQTPLASAGVSN